MKFRKRISVFWSFSSFFIGILPLLAGVAYWVAPSSTVFFQWLGIALPFFLILNLLIGILFVILGYFSRVFLFLLIVSWVIYAPLMFQVKLSDETKESDLTICSYNVRGMQSDYGLSTLHNIVALSQEEDFDILCLQEVPIEYEGSRLLEEFDHMKYIVLNDSISYGGNRLVILSKYPLKLKESKMNSKREFALLADISFKENDFTIVNCHLQTTSWNQIKGANSIVSKRNYSELVDNWRERERQVLSIQKSISRISHPLIVVGDFNAPPVSYSYHMLKSNRKDAFREAGSGFGNTYRYLSGLFRIDYIFYDESFFELIDYETLRLDYSDHYPIFAKLVVKQIKD